MKVCNVNVKTNTALIANFNSCNSIFESLIPSEILSVSQSNTHCCWFGRLQVDCSILPSCHQCRPVMRRVVGCGRCLENSSEVTSPWGRRCRRPGGLSAGSGAWWRTGLQGREDPGPVLLGLLSQTACSSPWTGSETLWEGLPRCLAVSDREQEAMSYMYKNSKESHAMRIICQQLQHFTFIFLNLFYKSNV